MSKSNAAVLAADSNPPSEFPMARTLKVTRARASASGDVFVKRDREPDIVFKSGVLLLTVETDPNRHGDPKRPAHNALEQRWRVWRLFESDDRKRAVVASEGHSSFEGETVFYGATVCKTGPEVWKAMGSYEELKPVLAELGWPAVEEV